MSVSLHSGWEAEVQLCRLGTARALTVPCWSSCCMCKPWNKATASSLLGFISLPLCLSFHLSLFFFFLRWSCSTAKALLKLTLTIQPAPTLSDLLSPSQQCLDYKWDYNIGLFTVFFLEHAPGTA